MITEVLADMLRQLSLEAGEREIDSLRLYLSLIKLGVKSQRLVGDRGISVLIYKHLFDSLYPLTAMNLKQGPLLDLGTGAGLPGVPLKIFLPETPIYLLDSNRRKINFVKHVSERLKLRNIYFLTGRAEHLAYSKAYRERFRYVFSRAVAKARILIELALPFAVPGGQVVLYKGPSGETEIMQAQATLQACGGQVSDRRSYKLPTGEQRVIIVINKILPTPSRYPRRGKQAQKLIGR
ncbi:MAG TPA: 16S rRNA (guanine(527)-N(7))-methyltransferase RsmG [Firmicutes bacterium]|nr:16S rRNA (guanine(527)-N(7))-methyltransferase RsmG [Bacillota bacterium]